MPQCRNCSADLTGQYCAACGQQRIDPDDLSARRYFRVLGRQIADFYLQFKTLRSLRALFSPGLLTREFVEGRRRPYLSPVKVYFVCAAIFFVAVPINIACGFLIFLAMLGAMMTIFLNFYAAQMAVFL